MKFYGLKNWFSSILDDPVYFIFPILTCMSFYGENSPSNEFELNKRSLKNDQTENDHHTEIKEDTNDILPFENVNCINIESENHEKKEATNKEEDSDSISVFLHNSSDDIENNIKLCNEYSSKDAIQVHISDIENYEELNQNKKHVMVFSPQQSIVLYILFFVGYLLCIGGDLAMQIYRSPNINIFNTITFYCLMLFVLNGLLWTDFIIHSFRSNEHRLISGT